MEDIKMYRKELGWEDVDWIDLAQGKHKWQTVVNVVVSLCAP
jgi:hypothetical protein